MYSAWNCNNHLALSVVIGILFIGFIAQLDVYARARALFAFIYEEIVILSKFVLRIKKKKRKLKKEVSF